MTERKVINKYYPPDYDPSKIPKLKHREKEKNRLWSIRVMAPFNMRCNTCAEYIYKGKKFNSRKETVEDEDYLGLQIHRFYIRCPRCVAVIAFKTDPQNCDYTLEAGASRNFEAAKTAEAMEKAAQKAREEEEANNPMKVLENRTKQSRLEMENIEILEELRDTNAKHAKVDHDRLIGDIRSSAELQRKRQEELEEAEVKEILGKSQTSIKRLYDIELDSSEEEEDDVLSGPARQKQKTTDRTADTSSNSRGPLSAAPPAASRVHSQSTSSASAKAARFGVVLKKALPSASGDRSAPAASLANKSEGCDAPSAPDKNGTIERCDETSSAEQQADAAVKNATPAAEPSPSPAEDTRPHQSTCQATASRVLLVGAYSDSGSGSDD